MLLDEKKDTIREDKAVTEQNHTDAYNASGAIMQSAPQFDPARYAGEVDQFDLTDAQKHELLSTLWSIMRSFVELGFTVDVCTALLEDSVPIPEDRNAVGFAHRI